MTALALHFAPTIDTSHALISAMEHTLTHLELSARGAACRFTGGTEKGGWGDTKGRPAPEEGPVGPSGRVKGEWLTCQKSETALRSWLGRRREA